MIRIITALAVCYLAGTTAGRGFLPYSVGLPANNFKNDVDSIAVVSGKLASPDNIKGVVSGFALDASRKMSHGMGVGH